jgi:hypothetical protein
MKRAMTQQKAGQIAFVIVAVFALFGISNNVGNPLKMVKIELSILLL